MNYLATLTPAEALMVLKEGKAPIKDLLKATFIDLIIKQVLQIYEVEKYVPGRDDTFIYRYVKEGSKYKDYNLREHEKIFTRPFKKDYEEGILFRNFVRIAYQNSRGEHIYKQLVYNCYNVKKCFNQNIFQQVFGGVSISAAGIKTKEVLHHEILNLERELPVLLKSGNKRAAEILALICGNIILLQNTDNELITITDRELLLQINNYTPFYSSINFDGIGDAYLSDFMDSFDSSCSADSACGGDGGCSSSGCSSGCGGCGGGD